MRSVLFVGSEERGQSLAEVLRSQGYAPELQLVEPGTPPPEAAVADALTCPIVWIDLSIGATPTRTLCRAFVTATTVVPPFIVVLGADGADGADVMALREAGAHAFIPDAQLETRASMFISAVRSREQVGELVARLAASEAAQREADRALRELLDQAPEAVLVHRDGELIWANACAATLLGYAESGGLVGRPFLDLVAPTHQAPARERLSQHATGLALAPFACALRHRDGEIVEVQAVTIPAVFEGAPASLTFARDLTIQRALEAELVAADRLAALGRLAASVGHEINNPLTYVAGNLELALRALGRLGAPAADVAQLVEDAIEGTRRIRRIVEDLRLFARRPSDDLGPVDVGAVIESSIRMSHGELAQRARLVTAIEPLPPVRGSDARLGQIITNLLLNAAEAIPEGAPAEHTIRVTARGLPDGHVQVVIEDTGVGISPEQLPHVFEPFFTTKAARGGSGLGLAICRSLLEGIGGEIGVDSQPGRGTRVSLRLAPAPAPAVDPPAPDDASAGAAVPPRRVLLVDDEPKIAALLREHLAPHHVVIATSGEEALALVAAQPFDVVVCDLMMPGLSGIDVYERLCEDHADLAERVIFMTGGAFTTRAQAFLARVPNPRLDKPFDPEALRAAIDQVLGTPPPAPGTGQSGRPPTQATDRSARSSG